MLMLFWRLTLFTIWELLILVWFFCPPSLSFPSILHFTSLHPLSLFPCHQPPFPSPKQWKGECSVRNCGKWKNISSYLSFLILRAIKAWVLYFNVIVTWLLEVGITVKCKWCMVTFYSVLYNNFIISLWMTSASCGLYIGNRSEDFICRSAVERFNCKWPLCSTAECVWELFVSRQNGRTENKTIRLTWKIAYYQRTSLLLVVLL